MAIDAGGTLQRLKPGAATIFSFIKKENAPPEDCVDMLLLPFRETIRAGFSRLRSLMVSIDFSDIYVEKHYVAVFIA